MATMIGSEKQLGTLLNHLIELDYDAIEAYEAAIGRLQDTTAKSQLGSFLEDHRRHVIDLTPLVQELGMTPAVGPDVKRVLTKGKVVIAGLMGDHAVLVAMKTNEDDTNKAYERALARTDLSDRIRMVLQRNLSDERRHREWIEQRIAVEKQIPARSH